MEAMRFDGETFNQRRDGDRLGTQLELVRGLMADGVSRSLGDIVAALRIRGCTATEASVSARLRDLRKERFGGYSVERTYLGSGLYSYRVTAGVEVGA